MLTNLATHGGRADLPVVAQLVDDLSIGGMERTAVNLANGIVAAGFPTHMVCTRGEKPLLKALDPLVQSYCAGRTRRWDFAGLRRVAAYLDEAGIEIVHSHNRSSSYLVRIALRFCRRKLLHVVHDHHGPAIHDRRAAVLDRVFLRHIDGFIATTEPLRDRAERILKLPESRCIYLPNGIDIPPLPAAWQGRPTVIQVANLHWPKGHATAIRAAALVRKEFPDLRWICVGRANPSADGYVENVRRLIAEHQLEECVDIVGERNDVPSLLATANVGVLTSDAEAFPLAILECMASAITVVTTDVGQAPAVIRSAGGEGVAPVGNAEAVAAAIINILRQPDRGRNQGLKNREYVIPRFSSAAMVAGVTRFYHELAPLRR